MTIWRVFYSARGPGHHGQVLEFDHDPSPTEIARRFGFIEGSAHFERIIDGSFTIEVTNAQD